MTSTIYGILGASDEFGRIRLLLTERVVLPQLSAHIFWDRPRVDIVGEVFLNPDKKHKDYWLEEAKKYRGQRVKVEYTTRKNINPVTREPHTTLKLFSLSGAGGLRPPAYAT